MGQLADYKYIFEGSPVEIDKAFAFIKKLQIENIDASNCNFSNGPAFRKNLTWMEYSFYSIVEEQDFENEILALTKGSNLVVDVGWFSIGGLCSGQYRLETGQKTSIREWNNAAIDLDTALEIQRMRDEPHFSTRYKLEKKVRDLRKDGWGEDDWTWLLTAAEILREIYRAINLDLTLADENAALDMADPMVVIVQKIREDLIALTNAGSDELSEIDGLLAINQEIKLRSAAEDAVEVAQRNDDEVSTKQASHSNIL